MTTSKQYSVTSQQLDACTRVIDEQANEVFYLVQSATDIERVYRVRYDKAHSCLSCTCPASNPPLDASGFPTYMPRTCWHMRAATEHNRQYHDLKKAEALARQCQEEAEMLRRVINAKPTHYTEQQIAADLYQPRPFRILDAGHEERKYAQARNVTHQCADGSWW